jgi:hypothetical protein
MTSGRRLFSAFAIACALALTPPRADATVMVKLSPEELVSQSDFVVRVVVGPQSTRWNEDQTRILTLTRLTVREYLKGNGAPELTLRQFGGTLEGMTLTVPGDGHLRPGEEAVLFLRRGVGVVYLTAMAQSVYEVVPTQQGPVVRRDLHDVEFASPSARGALVPTVAPAEPDQNFARFAESVRELARRTR